MRYIILLFLLSINILVNSQTNLSDNFHIGNYVEVFNNDSIKIYFSCTGNVVDKTCASFYRVGKMDSTIINVSGDFYDYYLDGKIYFKGTMLNNNLEGEARYYYENGKLKEEGLYKNHVRQGKWTFYYPNGNVQKVYNYSDGDPLVLEANEFNGKPTVIDKNGQFSTEFSVYLQCDKYEATGQIKNGKRDGEWKFFASPKASQPITIETYNEGKFIKGGGKNELYTDKSRIGLTDFYANENLKLLDNFFGCPGNRVADFQYKGQGLNSIFYPDLQNELSKYNKPIKNQWLVVGIKISIKNKLEEINIASSIDDKIIENFIYGLISKMKDWETGKINSTKVESDIFFTILIDDNQIIIPTDYIYRNR